MILKQEFILSQQSGTQLNQGEEIMGVLDQGEEIMGVLVRKLTNRSNEFTSVGVNQQTRLSGRLPFIVFITVLSFTGISAPVTAQSPDCVGIHVEVGNIENSTGVVACALFESPDGFPTEFLHSATNIQMLKIKDKEARCNFLDIPEGTYSLVVIHDENMDGKLGTNWLGIPNEGYGFSSGAEATMSAPSFEEASFSYGGQNINLKIDLSY